MARVLPPGRVVAVSVVMVMVDVLGLVHPGFSPEAGHQSLPVGFNVPPEHRREHPWGERDTKPWM